MTFGKAYLLYCMRFVNHNSANVWGYDRRTSHLASFLLAYNALKQAEVVIAFSGVQYTIL